MPRSKEGYEHTRRETSLQLCLINLAKPILDLCRQVRYVMPNLYQANCSVLLSCRSLPAHNL